MRRSGLTSREEQLQCGFWRTGCTVAAPVLRKLGWRELFPVSRSFALPGPGDRCCSLGPLPSMSIAPPSVPNASMTGPSKPLTSPGMPSSSATNCSAASYYQHYRFSTFCCCVSWSSTSSMAAKTEDGLPGAFRFRISAARPLIDAPKFAAPPLNRLLSTTGSIPVTSNQIVPTTLAKACINLC